MNWLIDRIKEPSTLVSVGLVIFGGGSLANAPEWANAIGVMLGALGMVVGERKK